MIKIKNDEFNLCYCFIKKEYGKLEIIFEFNCFFSILKDIQILIFMWRNKRFIEVLEREKLDKLVSTSSIIKSSLLSKLI